MKNPDRRVKAVDEWGKCVAIATRCETLDLTRPPGFFHEPISLPKMYDTGRNCTSEWYFWPNFQSQGHGLVQGHSRSLLLVLVCDFLLVCNTDILSCTVFHLLCSTDQIITLIGVPLFNAFILLSFYEWRH